MTSATGIPPVSRSPVARVAGEALAGAFAVAQRLRSPRPIHSRGVVLRGELSWIPDAAPAGIAFIDEAPAGALPVVARVSRSLGLPAPLPDVIGLAVRVDVNAWGRADARGATDTTTNETGAASDDDAPHTAHADRRVADIEFASTGWNVPARFALLPHRRAERARFGTLLPARGTRGPVLLVARTAAGRPAATDPREIDPTDDTPWVLTLGHATPAGPWHPFARLELGLDPDQDDRGLRFDAVRRPIPGARWPVWVRAARQPSYARVQPDDADLRRPETPRAPAPGGMTPPAVDAAT
ncbi:MAG: hypothetical protein PIR02_09495 [Microbacterium enclense]